MALSPEENERLADMLERLRPEVPRLKNDWQKSFIKDQIERHAKYGADMFLSAKQWAKIKEIYNETIGDQEEEPEGRFANDPDADDPDGYPHIRSDDDDLDDEIPF